MAKSTGETPLMQQHNAIKARYPDAILLFRVGDFYETFGQDAVNASGSWELPLPKEIMAMPIHLNWPAFRTMHWILICTNW